LRIRRFLHQQGFRLKPWCTQTEILDSFYDQLAQAHRGDDFWMELGNLAAEFALDLKQRNPTSTLTTAMVTERSVLMDAIRSALAAARTVPSGYRKLHTALPVSAMGLLLAITLAAVGCGGEMDGNASNTGTPAASGGTTGQTARTAVLGGLGGNPATLATGGTTSGNGSGGTASNGTGGSAPCASTTTPTIEAILDACGIDADAKQTYLAALNASEASWSTGVAEYFACTSCGEIASLFSYDCILTAQSEPYTGNPWDMCDVAVLIYVGVRFA
jgi:hypothetical protein